MFKPSIDGLRVTDNGWDRLISAGMTEEDSQRFIALTCTLLNEHTHTENGQTQIRRSPMPDNAQIQSIHALFGVENNYDQPDNDLVAWWHTKPTLRALAMTLVELKIIPPHTAIGDAATICDSLLLQGDPVRINNTDYRLAEVKESGWFKV